MLSIKAGIRFRFSGLCLQFNRHRSSVGVTDFYKVLGVKSDATSKEIKSAFFTLSKKYHPDVSNGDTKNEAKFIAISEAYKTLMNEDSRKEYDYNRNSFSTHTNNLHNFYSSPHHVHRPYMSSEAYRREFERMTRERKFYPPRDDPPRQDFQWNFSFSWRLYRLYIIVFLLYVIGYAYVRKQQNAADSFYVGKRQNKEQKKVANKYYLTKDHELTNHHPDILAITRFEKRRLTKPRADD